VVGRKQMLGQRLQASHRFNEMEQSGGTPGARGFLHGPMWLSVQSWALAEHKAFRPVPFLTLLYNPALQCHSGDVIHLAAGNHLKDGC